MRQQTTSNVIGGQFEFFTLVGPPGLEPGSAGYEPDALPLSYGPRRDYSTAILHGLTFRVRGT